VRCYILVANVGTMLQAKAMAGVIHVITTVPSVNCVAIFRMLIFEISNFELSKSMIFKIWIRLSDYRKLNVLNI
jgi:hypothetical protein